MKYFNMIKSLLPKGRAFLFGARSDMAKMLKALSALPEDVRETAEASYSDFWPDTTRFPEKWEGAFALFFTGGGLEKRRDILASMWLLKSGGQSAEFLQDVLRRIDGRINVVENVPVSNPRHTNRVIMAVNGGRRMTCGAREAVNMYRLGDASFTPSLIQNDASADYAVPNGEGYWSACFFVCGQVTRGAGGRILTVGTVRVSAVWKNYIEYIILKTKPAHTSAIVFIEWA